MDNNKITLKDALNTYKEILEKYRGGNLEEKEFACSAYEAKMIYWCLKQSGCSVDVEYEDGKGGLVKELDTAIIMTEFDRVGYVSFNPIKKATFLKKDVRFATGWRLKMFDKGYRWVENPYNPKKINYDHAQKYYVDVIKKVFWVVDLGG